MPPLDSAVREQGFRLQAFGFHKDDVLAYISSLAAESQQQEELYKEQLRQLQAQIEKLKSDQANARTCVEKLQQELTESAEREKLAEKQYDEAARKLAEAEKRVAEIAARNRENQQSANEWQFKCHDLERLLQEAREAAPPPPAPSASPESAPAPAPVRTAEDARLEARRILADARLTAENAEKRLADQAEAQRQKMADDAQGISAGILVLKDRLARVDARLDAASLDLENATAAIYQALEQTEGDLNGLSAQLEKFGDTASAPPSAAPAPQEPAPRQKATARRGRSARQPAPRGTARRLRRTSRTPVSQELLAALDRLDDQ